MKRPFARPVRARATLHRALAAILLLSAAGTSGYAIFSPGAQAAGGQPADAARPGEKPQERASLPEGWKARLAQTLWFDYTPTGFDPTTKPPRRPSEDDIGKDLDALAAFAREASGGKPRAGLVLYGCTNGLEVVPALASAKKLSVILGVWDPTSEAELRAAEKLLGDAGLADTVAAVCVGNEAHTFRRATFEQIQKAVGRLRRARSVPFTTTEVVHAYGKEELTTGFDFLFPNVHALFSVPGREPAEAARWTAEQVRALQKEAPDMLLLVKECGWPAGPAPAFDEGQQAKFWQELLRDKVAQEVNFCVFEASFNSDWKHEWVKAGEGGLPKDPAFRKGNEIDVGPFWSVFGPPPERSRKKAAGAIAEWWKRRSREMR